MKLVELLADIMEEWPVTTSYYAQDRTGVVYPWAIKAELVEGAWELDHCSGTGIDHNIEALSYTLDLASDWDETLVTKEMWLAGKGVITGDVTQTLSTGGGKMKLAEFLLTNVSEYNGHKQLEINNTTLSALKRILLELEEGDRKHMYAMQIFTDGSGCIEQLNYWDKGEHPLGSLDRTILSFTICDWYGEDFVH